eukprot:scaffold19588_cov18-Tisochrysis_lutea.AAC.4
MAFSGSLSSSTIVSHHHGQVEEPLFFVDFLREPEVDEETGETTEAHPSFYESVPGGMTQVRSHVEALQRKFNEESKVCMLSAGGFRKAMKPCLERSHQAGAGAVHRRLAPLDAHQPSAGHGPRLCPAGGRGWLRQA